MRKISNFGFNLKFFRRTTGLTQEEMAEKIGISYSYYARLETGHSAPSLDTLIKISNTLDIPIDFLVKDEASRAYKIYTASKIYQELEKLDDEKLKFYLDTLISIYGHLKEKNC